MSKEFSIEVQSRTTGKRHSRRARTQELIPAVVYGPKLKNMVLLAPERVVRRFTSSQFDNTIFTLKSADKAMNDVAVLMKHKDIHPVTRRLTHIDFYALDLTKTLKVSVELKFTGKPRGIADGGFFQPIERNIEVECLPNQIPTFIEADTSDLGVHESLHVSNLKLPDGVKVISDPGLTLCTVTIIAEEAAPVVAAATAAVEPEVIGKGKKEEGEGAAAAPAAGAPAKDAKKA